MAAAIRTMANEGHPLTIVPATLPPGEAAQYQSSTNSILWDQANVDAAVANGQNASEILFHEIDHGYLNYAFPGLSPNTIYTATNGSYTITYNSADPSAVDAYEHGLVSDDVQSAYGSDGTGATESAFGYVPGSVPGSATEAAGVTVTDPNGPVAPGAKTKDAADRSRGTKFAMPKNPATPIGQAMNQQGKTCPAGAPPSPSSAPQDLRTTAPGFFSTGATYAP